MKKIIAFRLNEKRARLIRQAQKRLKENNISMLIEKALEHLIGHDDYSQKIERVKGSVKLPPRTDSVKEIRRLRGHE